MPLGQETKCKIIAISLRTDNQNEVEQLRMGQVGLRQGLMGAGSDWVVASRS